MTTEAVRRIEHREHSSATRDSQEADDDGLAISREARRNRAFFDEHRDEILSAHKGKHIVITNGDRVHTFTSRSQKFRFIDRLSPVHRAAAFRVPRWRPGRDDRRSHDA